MTTSISTNESKHISSLPLELADDDVDAAATAVADMEGGGVGLVARMLRLPALLVRSLLMGAGWIEKAAPTIIITGCSMDRDNNNNHAHVPRNLVIIFRPDTPRRE